MESAIDGYRANNQTERKQFNGKLSFKPNEQTRVNVVFNQFDMPLAQDPLGLTAARLVANPQEAGTNAISRRVRKTVLQNQLGTSLTHELDTDRFVTARAYYGTRDNLQYQAGIPVVTPKGAWVGLNRDYYGVGLQYNELTKIGGIPVRWVAGYEFDRSQERRQGGAAALGEKTTTTRNEDNTAQNSDLFAQATALVADRVSLVGGLRYSTVRFTSEDFYLSDGNGSGSVRYSAINPVLGLTYHVTDNLNLYANYGKGFETPTLADWGAIDAMSETDLERRLLGSSLATSFARPDHGRMHQELRRKGVTLMLLWQEYSAQVGDEHCEQSSLKALRYSQFSENYRQFAKRLKRSMRQSHRAGEKMFIDYAGPTIALFEHGVEVERANIFVAAMAASGYSFALATKRQTAADWLNGTACALTLFGGVPQLIIPDNPRALVTQANRYEPLLTDSVLDFARHLRLLGAARARLPPAGHCQG